MNEQTVTIKQYPDVREYGIPAQVFLVERLCPECNNGLMRPTGRAMQNPQGQQIFLHGCTSEYCEKIEALPIPYPRPDFQQIVDPLNAVDAMAASTEQREGEGEQESKLKLVKP